MENETHKFELTKCWNGMAITILFNLLWTAAMITGVYLHTVFHTASLRIQQGSLSLSLIPAPS